MSMRNTLIDCKIEVLERLKKQLDAEIKTYQDMKEPEDE